MIRKIARKSVRYGATLIEIAAFAVLVLALLTAVLIGRIGSGPLEIGFARDYIQSALYDDVTGNRVVMDGVALYWPDIKGPLFFQLRGARLLGPDGKAIVSVDEAAISFSRAALLLGRVRPKSIILKGPSLRVARNEGNSLDFGFGPAGEWGGTLADGGGTAQRDVLADIFEYIARPGRESKKNSLISRLESFEIEDARLVVEDHVLGISWFLPDFDARFISTLEGMRGDFALSLPDVGGRPSGLRIAMDYVWDEKDVRLSADMKTLDTMILAGKMPDLDILREQSIVLDAHLEAVLGPDFTPQSLSMEMVSDSGSLFHAALSPDPVSYRDFVLALAYDAAKDEWDFSGTQVTLGDATVQAQGHVKRAGQGVDGTMTLRVDELAQEKIAPLWPAALRGDSSEEWIVHKMSGGLFRDVALSFDFGVLRDDAAEENTDENPWSADVRHLKAAFAAEGMRVEYRPPLFPAENVTGRGAFDRDADTMTIEIESGKIGGLDVKRATLIFDEVVAEGKGGVDMDIHLNGPLKDALAYVSEEPINLDEDTTLDFRSVEGKADLNVHLAFPTHKDVKLEEFTIGVEGTLDDVLVPDIVGDLDLSGGPLTLRVKDGAVSASGKALLEKRDLDFEWMEYLESQGRPYTGKVKARLTADPNIRQRLGIDLDDFIEGPLPLTVDYTSYGDGKAVADIVMDATPALFFVDPFDFGKPPGEVATAALTAHLENKELKEITGLTAQGQDFKLAPSHLSFRKNTAGETALSEGALENFTLGKTKGKLTFKIGKDGVAKMLLDAQTLDARPFLDVEENKQEYGAPPIVISASAAQMFTGGEESVQDVRIFMDIDGQGRFNQMEMDATAGAGVIYLRFKPDQEGKRVFRLETEDAGAALKAFQVYKNIRGGKMIIYGEPIRGIFDRNLAGVAEITDFKVVRAPALTKLLSILSLPGLMEVLGNEGLSFTKLEAHFNWVYRKAGSLLVLKDGRTSGNSLGLTFDGTFDKAQNKVDVSGTLIPMSGVNSFIGKIPLIGDILTGGSGSLIAATYSVKGDPGDPVILVNPLSVLAPGILRRILFE